MCKLTVIIARLAIPPKGLIFLLQFTEKTDVLLFIAPHFRIKWFQDQTLI